MVGNNMVMKQKSFKKGELGEQIGDRYFLEKKFMAYTPKYDGAHLVDRFFAKLNSQVFALDYKTKPARFKFGYRDTGIDVKHYERYKKMKLHVYLCFVDEKAGEIYGNWLCILEEKYKKWPMIEKCKNGDEIIYFHRDKMKTIAPLTEVECMRLKELTTKSLEYEKFY